MTDKLDDVWATRDYPVLVEVARRVDQGQTLIPSAVIAEALHVDEEIVRLAYDALDRRGLIVGSSSAEMTGLGWADTITGEAYLITGLHPSGDDALSSLVAALRQAADLEPDPAEKGRIKAAADSLLGISRNVATGVLTAWLTHHVPGAGK